MRPSALPTLALALLIGACSSGDDTPKDTTPAPSPPLAIIDERGMPTELTCPGSPGCVGAGGPLLVGAAVRTITPLDIESYTDKNDNGYYDADEPFDDKNGNGKLDAAWLAGFSPGRAATGVHDDAWARVLTFSQGDTSVALVSLDLIGLFHDSVIDIRKAARDKGLDFDHIMVSTTHVHETRDTMGMWGSGPAIPGIDTAYMQFIVDRVVEALTEARQKERAARVKAARAEAPALVNDTRSPDVSDPGIYSLQFVDEASKPFATMLTWGNHPEALGSSNTLLTSDYAHYLRGAVEARYPDSTAVFFSGNLGGLTTTIGIVGCPDAQGKETCPQGTFERAEYVGRGAAEAAIAALDAPSAQITDAPSLAVRRRPLLLGTTNPGLSLLLTLGVLPRKVHAADGRLLSPDEQKTVSIGDLTSGLYRIASEVNAIEIGPAIVATVPGELYSELWMARDNGESFVEQPANADFPGAPREPSMSAMLPDGKMKIVINNANDAVGYIVPKPQWDRTSPYAYDPDGQYGEQNSLGEETAPTLIEAFRKLYP